MMKRKDLFLVAGLCFLSAVFGGVIGSSGVQKLVFARASQKTESRQGGALHKKTEVGEQKTSVGVPIYRSDKNKDKNKEELEVGKGKGGKGWLEPTTDYIDGNLVVLGTLGAADDGKVIKWNNTAGKLVKGDAGEVPAGVIVMWSGTLASIPADWALCDGTAPTPDLRDKFVYGTSAGVDPGGDGGSTSHSHDVQIWVRNYWTGVNTYHGGILTVTPFSPPTSVNTGIKWVKGQPVAWSAEALLSEGNSAGSENYDCEHKAGVQGTTASAPSLPPYYKLAFIMKL